MQAVSVLSCPSCCICTIVIPCIISVESRPATFCSTRFRSYSVSWISVSRHVVQVDRVNQFVPLSLSVHCICTSDAGAVIIVLSAFYRNFVHLHTSLIFDASHRPNHFLISYSVDTTHGHSALDFTSRQITPYLPLRPSPILVSFTI